MAREPMIRQSGFWADLANLLVMASLYREATPKSTSTVSPTTARKRTAREPVIRDDSAGADLFNLFCLKPLYRKPPPNAGHPHDCVGE